MAEQVMIKLGELIDNRFLPIGVMGSGAGGIVYKAEHDYLKIPLAIKQIDISSMTNEQVERVRRECRIGGELGEIANVVRVLDAFRYEDKTLLIVMDCMEGDLYGYIHKNGVAFGQALNWALDLATTLLQVHRKGIIHRDIKPQNILLDAHGRVKFCDFGVAHVSRSHLTAGSQPGTPAYKAPELDHSDSSEASDVYSLCAVFFEMWIGGSQYANYKSLEYEIVRNEFLYHLEQTHPAISQTHRELLATLILSGLLPVDKRASLEQIIEGLKQLKEALENQPGAPVDVVPTPPARPYFSPRPTNPAGSSSVNTGSETALVDWAVQALENLFQEEVWSSRRRTLFFWYDPGGEWTPLVGLIGERLNLIVDRGSLLEVRYWLEQFNEKEPLVVYLNRSRGQPGYLTPYEFQSVPVDLPIYEVLRKNGVPLPVSGDSRKQIQKLIPQLVVASLGQGEVFWQGIDSYDNARKQLLGEPQEILFGFLAAPLASWVGLEQQSKVQLFVDEIQKRYGFSKPEVDPPTFARELYAHWCKVKLYLDYGKPASYPYLSQLPNNSVWANCQTGLAAFLNDRRFQSAVFNLAQDVEKDYGRLVEEAQRISEFPENPPLPGLALLAWEQDIDRIKACESQTELIALLRSKEAHYKQSAQSFWAQQGLVPGWAALLQGWDVVMQSETACAESSKLVEPGQFVEAYTGKWWKIDLAYRRYRELPESDTVAAAFTGWVERSYLRYVEKINQDWTHLLQTSTIWPPLNTIHFQTEVWDKSIGVEKGRKAVFFIDALRYDLGQEVAELLAANKDNKIESDVCLAGLPSITSLGMAGLLPQATTQTVNFETEWQLDITNFKGNLALKSAREAYLEQQLKNTQSLSLEDLLKPQTKLSQDAKWLLVSSQEIDSLGENVSEVALDVLGITAQRLAQAVRKVLEAGFTTVHIVTDHGFLLLNRVEESNKVSVPAGGLKLGQRYLIGKDFSERSDLLRFRVRGSAELWGYYPPGIAAFSTRGRYQYSHGGPTLHEVVLPHLVVRRAQVQRKVGIKIVAPDKIHNAIFSVELKPLPHATTDLEREVKLGLERENGTLLDEVLYLVSGDASSKNNLRLKPTYRLNPGDNVILVARDAQTGEELDRQVVEVRVDLDL